MKNLILGVAKGYGWHVLEPFVTSCKMNCPDADLVLFVDDISDFTRDYLKRWAKVFDIPAEYEGVHIIHTRWKMYLDYLDRHGDDYETVFVADTRDVIFQADVFAPFKSYANWLGYTTEADDIGGSKTGDRINYNWLVSFFGKAAADKLVDRKIICCGTVIATVAEMKILCRIMWELLKAETVVGHEQALMNYAVYNRLLPVENLVELDVQSGEIFTAGLAIKQEQIGFRDNMVLRGDGGVPAVVHQYDKYDKDFYKFVDNIYRDKNFTADARFTDPRSTLEQVISLLYADKTVEASRLFLKKFFVTEDFGRFSAAKLITILELASEKVFTPAVEALELAVQNALLSSAKGFSGDQLTCLHEITVRALKNNRAVDPDFKELLAECFLKIASCTLEAHDAQRCFFCIAAIEELDTEPDENFRCFVDEANRTFGRRS